MDYKINFTDILSSLKPSNSFEDSYKNMLQLSKFIDINTFKDSPETIFELHRQIARRPDLLDVGIRFTVQINLFMGSIYTFGTDKHQKILANKNIVGSFALTEKKVGVVSGLKIYTNAVWDESKSTFKLTSLDRKNWISQGYVSDYCVVFAKVFNYSGIKDGTIYPFLLDMKLEGISKTLMPEKTAAKYLDNVELFFNDVEIDEDSLMNRVKITNFMNIADRLLTGRLILAQCCFEGCKSVFDKIENYAKNKKLDGFKNRSLYDVPSIKNLFRRFREQYRLNNIYNSVVERTYCKYIKKYPNIPLQPELIKKINICKIVSTERVCELISELQIKIGSVSLTHMDANLDSFLTFRFAEGDTNILRQKIVRDTMSNFCYNYRVLYLNIIMLFSRDKMESWLNSEDLIYKISNDIIINSASL